MSLDAPPRLPSRWEAGSALRLPALGLAVAIAVLLSLGYVTHRETVEQEEAALLVEHTHLVLEALQEIPSGLGVAEGSLRGFALQRDPTMIEDFEPAILEVQRGLAAARTLTRDDPAQQRRLDGLEPKVERRIELLRDRLARVRATGSEEIPLEARTLTRQIRAATAEMVDVELHLLDARSAKRAARLRRMRIVSPLGIFASITLVGVAFALFYGEVRHRRRAEKAAEEQGARLRVLVKETALMLEMGELLSACGTIEEANALVERFAPRFFPRASGAVCMLNESQNLLELHSRWGARPVVKESAFSPEECWALRRGKQHRSTAGETGVSCPHLGAAEGMTLCLPLLANGQVIGSLHVVDERNDVEQVERRAMVVGEQVGLALSNLRLRDRLRNQSIRDPLTGLFNRRYTDETLGREIHRAARDSAPVSVLVMDVDFFKKFNDSFGHQAGDRVLSALGALMRKSTRGADVPSRMGGEELAVVMPGARIEDAAKRAEAIRAAVEQMDVVHEGKEIGPVTLSIGVAAFPQHGSSGEDVFRVADGALYRAKREGRNRVVVAE